MAYNSPDINPFSKPTTSPASSGPSGGDITVETQLTQQQQIALLQSQYPGLSIEGIMGGLPVAEQNQEYFAVFDEAGDTSPEIIGKTQFKIIYLCDSKLNTSKPAIGNIATKNLIQNFPTSKPVTVRADQGTALNPQLVGTHNILAIGSIAPVVGSQIGKGALQYVTTMSFNPESQIGLPGGLNVTNYVNRYKKSWGYNNGKIASTSSGEFTFYRAVWPLTDSSTGAPLEPETSESITYTLTDGDLNATDLIDEELPQFEMYFDKIDQFPTGSGTIYGTDGSRPSYFGAATTSTSSSMYITNVTILTSSLQGNTRVKIKSHAGVRIVTSSVADIVLSTHKHSDILGLYSNNPIYGGGNQSAQNLFYHEIKYEIIRERNGTKEVVMSNTGVINTFNPSLGALNEGAYESWYENGSDTYIEWNPFLANYHTISNFNNTDMFYETFPVPVNPICYIGGGTDWLDVEVNDKFYGRITLPQEITNFNVYPWKFEQTQQGGFNDNAELHPEGLISASENWGDVAAFRTYEIFTGAIKVEQEVRAGNGFTAGVHGVTASYTDSDGNPSLYNYTSSYWSSYNNFSGSSIGTGAWLTASAGLAQFYGGDYYQINPGTEIYNTHNLELLPSTSLSTIIGEEEFKKSWINLGGSPFRLPFKLEVGDYIRFEYQPSKEYKILAVQFADNILKIKLDNYIYPSTILDNFIVYRIIPDGQYIIMDVRKDIEAGINQAFKGIIMPTYPSENLNKKQDELIYELKKAGIIEDGANNRVDIT